MAAYVHHQTYTCTCSCIVPHTDYNVDNFVDMIIDAAMAQANKIPDGHKDIRWAMGQDFRYVNAHKW